jgi:hypothetical protein
MKVLLRLHWKLIVKVTLKNENYHYEGGVFQSDDTGSK